MPMLMEKKDWAQTVSSFAKQDRVWQEDVCGDTGVVSLSLPELGRYRVFLVKVNEVARTSHICASPETCHDWHDLPVSPLVDEITGIIPDENPKASYREIISDAICDKYLTDHETVH